MLLTFYSFLMATLASCLMIVITYFLKKTRFYTIVFNVPFLILIYVLSFARMFIPIEFPDFQYIIQDEYVLAPVIDVLENRTDWTVNLPILVMDIFGIVFTTISAILIAVFVVRQLMYMRRVRICSVELTEREQVLFDKAVVSVFGKKKNVRLVKTGIVNGPMVTGFLNNTVLLPCDDYSDKELEFIFVHECTHLKNKDIWLKLLIHIYCCIFWWNPFAYLLKADVGFLLELKCDKKVCFTLDEERKLDYMLTVNDNVRRLLEKKVKRAPLVSSGFAFANGTKLHKIRMNTMLNPRKNTKSTIACCVLISVLIATIWVASFVIIWQPSYTIRNSEKLQAEVKEPGAVMSDETNAYLVEQPDGNYFFYFDGYEVPVPKEEYDAGLYDTYPVLDEPLKGVKYERAG